MKETKWIRILVFWLILVLLVAGLSLGLKWMTARDNLMVHEHLKVVVDLDKEADETVDALILGDSLSYTTLSSMKLWQLYGIPTYSCGQSGQSIMEAYQVLKAAYDHQSPKVVMLESHMIFQAPEGWGSLDDAIAYWGIYHIPLWEFHDVWKYGLFDIKYSQEHYKGYTIRGVVQPYTGGPYMTDKGEKVTIPSFGRMYLKKIQKLCEDHGSKLVIFSAPSPANYNYATVQALQNYADAHELPYVDYNELAEYIALDWQQDSLDGGDHLNIYGANKATAYMGAWLALQDYGLKDHRDEEKYRSWDEDLKAYMVEEARFVPQ